MNTADIKPKTKSVKREAKPEGLRGGPGEIKIFKLLENSIV
jgi:hypothetical protein